MICFQFRIYFDHDHQGDSVKFGTERALRAWTEARGMDCYIGALGGGRVAYGAIFRESDGAGADDRAAFVEWVRSQPIVARAWRSARLSPLQRVTSCGK